MSKTVKKCKNLAELAYYLRDCGMKDEERCDIQDMLMKHTVDDLIEILLEANPDVQDNLFWAIWGCLDKNTAHRINKKFYNSTYDSIYKTKFNKTLEDLTRVEEKLTTANANGRRESDYLNEAKAAVKFLLTELIKSLGGDKEANPAHRIVEIIKYCSNFIWLTKEDIMDAIIDEEVK